MFPPIQSQTNTNTSIKENADPVRPCPLTIDQQSQNVRLNLLAPPFVVPERQNFDNLGARPKEAVSALNKTQLHKKPKANQTCNAKTSLKHVPPITPHEFEEETATRQINIAQAKIQELEFENTSLKKTNHILNERIKLLEKTSKKTHDPSTQ